jgi:hypothetical protein
MRHRYREPIVKMDGVRRRGRLEVDAADEGAAMRRVQQSIRGR